MIACDICGVWQHLRCLGLPESDEWDERTYYCEQCKPEDHQELIAAMERGEKPWNRKKGAKPAKSKARPSDVKLEAEPETKAKPPTPTSAAPQLSPKGQAKVQTKEHPKDEPKDQTKDLPNDQPKERSNGHVEPKVQPPVVASPTPTHKTPQPAKKDAPRSQPHSPLGEKRRRETTSEKEGGDSKRRKSSVHQRDSAPESPVMGTEVAILPEKQRLLVETLVKNMQTMVKQASETRDFRIPDGETPSSIANRLALQIDHAAVKHYGAPATNDSPYVVQFRSIIFNTKKNPVLLDRLLSGSLTADGIATMTAEEMASEDKQREYAALREANEKQVVLIEDQGPRIRKTHKGEEFIEDDHQSRVTQETTFTAPERRHRDIIQESSVIEGQSTRDGGSPMRVELPEEATRAPLTIDTSTAQSATVARHPSSAAFDVKEVWRHVRSPDQEQQAFQRRQSSIAIQIQQQEGPGDDADVDRLLKDEDNDTIMEDYSADPTVCWQGSLEMQGLGSFSAVARFVAGGDFGQAIPWTQLLTSKLPIQGRIDKDKGNEYIASMSTSSTTDVAVLALTPVNAEGRAQMEALFHYFHPRNRWGVVPVDRLGSECMRDLYVIPIEAGGSNLPGFLDMLDHCTIETPRPQHMVVLALVAKVDDLAAKYTPAPSSNHYPPGEVAPGQIPVPTSLPHNTVTPSTRRPSQAPQFSPVGNLPPGSNYGSPYPSAMNRIQSPQTPQFPFVPAHHQIPKAVEVFGPFIDSPVIVQLLSSFPTMSEVQMTNLRSILETKPAARTDMNVLQEHLTATSGP
jgi:hypothetical protein